jgi:hypothetical protein
MNYWKLKRGVDVAVFASTRSMNGDLLLRERLSFDKGEVINYRVPVDSPFEGSIEIEVFSTQNIAIPYGAIICQYQTLRGYSFVHSYARAYSQHEIEEGRTLSVGREACWTCRDTCTQRSFAVIHNGSLFKEAQKVELVVRNSFQDMQHVTFDWPALKPYQTRLVRPSDYFPNLIEWLGGEPGQAKLDFELGGGFTRMLVGNERLDYSDMQVTHSNFDYSRQPTDMAEPNQRAFMHVPACGSSKMRIIVYPDSCSGDYSAYVNDLAFRFSGGDAVYEDAPKAKTMVFERVDGPMPTRLVTALEIHEDSNRLPGECSLGVLSTLQPQKRLWWGSIAAPEVAKSRIVIHDLPEVYGGIPSGEKLFLSLYSAFSFEALKANFIAHRINDFSDGVLIEDIWPDAEEHLGGQSGYYTMYSSYGGLTVYTLTRNVHGSVCLEHGF